MADTATVSDAPMIAIASVLISLLCYWIFFRGLGWWRAGAFPSIADRSMRIFLSYCNHFRAFLCLAKACEARMGGDGYKAVAWLTKV